MAITQKLCVPGRIELKYCLQVNTRMQPKLLKCLYLTNFVKYY